MSEPDMYKYILCFYALSTTLKQQTLTSGIHIHSYINSWVFVFNSLSYK